MDLPYQIKDRKTLISGTQNDAQHRSQRKGVNEPQTWCRWSV